MDTWERQRKEEGELEKNLWFDRFTDYRLMGSDRSLLETVNCVRDRKEQKRTNDIPGSWRRNAKKWHWLERAEAWDAEQRNKRIKAEEKARAEMIKRHIKLGRELQKVGGKRLKQLENMLKQIPGSEARQYIKDGIAVERQARGLPEYLLAVAAMSDEELRNQYAALLGSIAEISGDGDGDGTTGDETISPGQNKT